MYKTLRSLVCLLAVLPLLLISACSDDPVGPTEQLASLQVQVPTVIALGEVFTVTVRAVGDQGTTPFSSFEGPVRLSVSSGTITPDSLQVIAGEGSISVRLSAVGETVRITATHPSAKGEADVSITALSQLPGNPNDPVNQHIPLIPFLPDPNDYDDQHPDLLGLQVSRRTILMTFDSQSTVQLANQVLAQMGALIVGGLPSNSEGAILAVRIPTNTHAAMDSMRTALRTAENVLYASPDVLLQPDTIPDSHNGLLSLWEWNEEPFGGNWGLELIRMPQAWNLMDAVEKESEPRVSTGIIDGGFQLNHPDLEFAEFGLNLEHDHGTHVAGIIAAKWGNGLGVDGVNPYAELRVRSGIFSWMVILQDLEGFARNGVRVVNMSFGWRWEDSPDASPIRSFLLELQGDQYLSWHRDVLSSDSAPLLVVSAGNDSRGRPDGIDARYNSPFAWVALTHGEPGILIVESLADISGLERAESSNVNGHVSAPGARVFSTVTGSSYAMKSGTSMAAPHVAGLVGYLLALEPTLSRAELTTLILGNTKSVDTSGHAASPHIDAFDSAIDIDRIRGGDRIARMLLDIDDGSVDGNLRVRPESPGQVETRFDLDGDGGIGDGVIDMSDFRRWRDWWLQVSEYNGAILDGPGIHPKRDLNGDDLRDDREHLYPRGDFNGDGILDPANKMAMVGFFTGIAPLTDIEVMGELFSDPHYTRDDLDGLVYSGDIHVDLEALVSDPQITTVTSKVTEGSTGVVHTRTHGPQDPLHIYSIEESLGPFELEVVARDAAGNTVCTDTQSYELSAGQDHYYFGVCAGLEVEITLAAQIEPGVASPLTVRAGLRKGDGSLEFRAGIEIALSATGGSVTPASSITASDGFITGEATLAPGAGLLTVTASAFDPVSGGQGQDQASATALGAGGGKFNLLSGGFQSVSLSSVSMIGQHPLDQQTSESDPLDLSPFSAELSTFAELSDPRGFTTAEATTSMNASLIVDAPAGGTTLTLQASGSISAFAQMSGELAEIGASGASSSGASFITLEFLVFEDSMRFSLSGHVAEDDRTQGSASVGLTRLSGGSGGGTIARFLAVPFTRNGVLEPGTYRLTLESGAFTSPLRVDTETFSADFELSFTLF